MLSLRTGSPTDSLNTAELFVRMLSQRRPASADHVGEIVHSSCANAARRSVDASMSPEKPGSDGVPSMKVNAFSSRVTPSAATPAVRLCASFNVWKSLPFNVHERSWIVVVLRWSRTGAKVSVNSSVTVLLRDRYVPTLARSSVRVDSSKRFFHDATSRASVERLDPRASLVAYGAGVGPSGSSSVPAVRVLPSDIDRKGCRLNWSPRPRFHCTRELACNALRSSCWICRSVCASVGAPVATSV